MSWLAGGYGALQSGGGLAFDLTPALTYVGAALAIKHGWDWYGEYYADQRMKGGSYVGLDYRTVHENPFSSIQMIEGKEVALDTETEYGTTLLSTSDIETKQINTVGFAVDNEVNPLVLAAAALNSENWNSDPDDDNKGRTFGQILMDLFFNIRLLRCNDPSVEHLFAEAEKI